jgi:hypothetical protein
MAEFKLGRIRFVWKGDWTADNTYYQDDVVAFGGKTFICTIGHTSQTDFYSDFDIVPPKWNLVSDGQTWKSEWTVDTDYVVDDIVSYGARLYICNTAHTSAATAVDETDGLEVDIDKWDAYAEGLDWKGDWSTSTRYRVNDFVKYGGSTYVCNTLHVSTATASDGLENDIDNWDVFNNGLEYKGEWASSTRYKLNDLVRYGAGVWICTTAHTSTTDLGSDSDNWSKFVEGFQYENDWSPFRAYQPGDVVRYGGNQYISRTNHTEVIPGPLSGTITNITANTPAIVTSANHGLQDGRQVVIADVEGMTEINGEIAYVKLVDSNSFELYTNSNLLTPFDSSGFTAYTTGGVFTSTAPTDWDLFTEGFRFIGDWNEDSANTEYKVGEVVRLGGFTYVCVRNHDGQQPPNDFYWKKVNEGIRWRGEWIDDQEYFEGDVVRYGTTSYICIKYHISEGDDYSTETLLGEGGGAEGSRPDLADSGQYWSAIAIGSEQSVLTTAGDLVYYSGSAPTRLPIGKEGQVLTVNSDGVPNWEFLQSVEDVYFVAEHGIDRPFPEYGSNIDRPFKTIRYACEQIEKGPKYPNAQYLLEMNRVFIQEEVTSWINAQIDGGSGIWSGFTYAEDKCKRDVGFIVDRIKWDLGHGGNLKTRAATQTYLNALGDGPYSTDEENNGTGTYNNLGAEYQQDVASYNYMLEVIQAVLNNEAPDTIYQNVTDDSTAIVDQFIDTTVEAEAGSYTRLAELVSIVTTALASRNTNDIPDREVPQTLVKISTGKHYEVLPIRVPAYCAILGDELRSTHIIAGPATTPVNDTYYTIKTFDRVAEVVKDIVTGTTVTPTTGNTQVQSQEWPLAITTQADTVETLVDVMKYNIDYGLKTMESAYVTDPITLSTGDENAIENIKANIDFLIAEVIAYLDEEYEDLKYGKTDTRRDARYVIDSLIYDITYGGNAQAVMTGLAYWDGDDNTQSQLPASIKTETIAVLNYLKTSAQSVAGNSAVINPYQSAITQTLTGNVGNIAAIANNIEDIIEIINTGPSAVGTTVTLVDPTPANNVNSTTALIAAYSDLNGKVSTIQDATIDYINTNYGDFKYDSALCRRDAGFLVDAGYYDAAFGSNFWAVQNGISYFRPQASVVTSQQREQEIGSIDYIKTQAATSLASNATAVARAEATYDEIIDILRNGVANADAIVYTDTGVANATTAREQLVNNRAVIIDEGIAWINSNYPLLTYDETLCRRDIGYTVDALAYDAQYGGNLATKNVMRSLFDQRTDTSVAYPTVDERTAGAAFYTQLGVICGNIVRATGGYTGQNTSAGDAGATYDTLMDTLAGYVSTAITNNDNDLDTIVADSAPVVTWAAAGIQTAVASLASDKTDIVKGTLQFITNNYSSLVYDHAKCSRDVAKILKAVGYDFQLNSNWQTLKHAHSYRRKTASEVYTANQKTATRGAIAHALTLAKSNVNSDTLAQERIDASARIIDAIIFGATADGSVCQTEEANAYYAMLQLERNRDFIVEEVRAYVDYNFVNFDNYYNSTTCARDVGLIIDAVSYDLITGSNFASSVAGAAYYRIQSANVTGTQLMQTLDIIKYIRKVAKTYVTDSANYLVVYNAFTNVYNILERGLDAVPTYTFPDNGTTAADDSTTAATFQSNRATIISDVSAWLASNQTTQWNALGAEGQAVCQRDMGYIIDAATYDVAYGGNYQSVIAGDSYYSYGTLQIGTGDEKTATLAALTQLKAELVADAEASSQAAVGNNMDDIIDIVTNGAGAVAITYPSATGEDATTQSMFTNLQSNKATIQGLVTTYITDTYSSYTYNEALCLRDVGYYIDALKYDLMHPGNYASRYVARFYNNAVTGSQEEDMFYLRDATGVRNCTLNGLNGDLTPPNEFGYSQVTAGAYCSLDPGFGPEDFRTWIITRSPYIQGVTTFGNAATGQKIDGALHNGGNDSFVSNDFTQVISDGIGAHILNNGRAELVSVFTYYSHVGYLAETGGRIRATNGNNSYGTYGSVATGVDPDETPVTAIVDNRTQYSATINEVNVDNSQILSLEFTHAGNDYTEATLNIFGPGSNEELIVDEFRDGALNYVYIDQDADPDVPQGGSGYLLVSNVAQSGSTTGIFLAATDGNLSTAYPGMKIYILGGAGVGQYAIVDTYNAGTKEATVIRESDGVAGWDHIVPGTPIVAPNSSSTYQIEPRITISTPTNSNTSITLPTSTTWYDVKWLDTSAQYTGVSGTTSGVGVGATFDVTRNSTKYYLDLNNAGTGYSRLDTITIAGGDVGGDGLASTHDITITITTVNSVTGAIVEYDFAGYACNGTFLAVGAGTNGAVSLDGETWTAETLPTLGGGNYSSIASGLQNDGSSTFKPSAIVAVADGDDTVAYSSDADTWLTTSLPGSFNATGENTIAFGQIDSATARFVVISDADQDVTYSDNGGATWSITGTALPATGYGEMAFGAGKFVAINSGTTSAAYSTDGINWTAVVAPGTFASATDIVWGNGKFVALGGTNGIMYSLDGITWYENDLTLPLTATERKLAYGQGTFVITSDDTNEVQYSHDGVYWQAYTLSTTITGGYNAIAFGNPDRVGKFVILPNAAGTSGNTAKINTPAKARASVSNEQIFEIRITEPGSGYTSVPTLTVTDPNNIDDVVLRSQIGDGAIANPTFVNRGTGFTAASAEIDAQTSNGYANFPQAGTFIAVRRMTSRPVNGSNVVFENLPGEFFKLVNVLSFLGTEDGSYTGFLQISPAIPPEDDLPDGDPVEMRIRFSQVRLTGHDFLDIGTGGFTETNYPNAPVNTPNQANETVDNDGGRVFYTATDQDGNFRVGDLFTIEQSTGVATLNADAFNIAGLQELSLGEVTLGGNSATINEFSTDPFFTANSDNVVPTQRAVKAYIEAQIGGGGATLNVNSVTAGDIFIGADTITTLSGTTLNINANVVFSGTVLGLPLAYNYFLR